MEASFNALRSTDSDRDPAVLPVVPNPDTGPSPWVGWLVAVVFGALLWSMRSRVKRSHRFLREATQPDFFLWNASHGERRRRPR